MNNNVTASKLRVARVRDLMEQARTLGASRFEPSQNLLRHENVVTKYTGYTVGQQSLEYAIALLETAKQTGDEAKTANAIINRVLEFQVRDPRHHRCGNFIWMTHWDEPRDPNAVAFLTPNLVYLYQQHSASLGDATRHNLETAFPLCAQALLQREVPYEYTNIKALTTLSQFMLAPLVPQSALENTARFHWLHWVTFIAQYGITEYNSPTYLPVMLNALEQMWQYGPPDLKAEFERVLEYFYFEFAARYHAPTGYLCGAMSRAYPNDLITGQGMSALVAHLQWGIPYKLAGMNDVRWLRNTYQAPDEVRHIALEKQLPLQIGAYTHHPNPIERTDYLTPQYSLGSQNGYTSNQEMPFFITVKSESARRSIWVQASASGLAILSSQQEKGRIAGIYYYDWQAVRDNAGLRNSQPDLPLEFLWHLGSHELIEQISVNGQHWDGEAVSLGRDVCLDMKLGEVPFGLKLRADELCPRDALKLAWREQELILTVRVCARAQDYIEGGKSFGMAFYLQLASAEEQSLDALSADIAATEWEISSQTNIPTQCSLLVGQGKKRLGASIPLLRYLHNSKLAQIRPNDLLLWFQGKEEDGRDRLFSGSKNHVS